MDLSQFNLDTLTTFRQGIDVIEQNYINKVSYYLKKRGDLGFNNANFTKSYSVVLKVCDELDKAKELHEYFKEKLIRHIKQNILPELENKEEEILLKIYIKEWKDFTILVHFMRKMFNYLDRYYLKNNNAVALSTTALHIFRDQCFLPIHERLRRAILNQITRDRNNEMVDLDLLKRAIYTFVEMGFITADIVKQDDEFIWKGDKNNDVMYVQKFQVQLIERTKQEYQTKAQGWMMSLNCPEYLGQAEQHLLKEEDRANYFLQPETKVPLLNAIQGEIIEKQASNLVDKEGTGCDAMFQHSKLDELSLMYRVFKRVETTLKYIIAKMQPYIENRGEKIVGDDALKKDPVQFTAKLLAFKAEMDVMVEKSFQNDIKFQRNRDVSFTNFMNKCEMTPHFVAAYCDNEFRKGLRGVGEAETNARLDAIIRLFCCIHSRDIFIKAYTRHLASRLLNKTFLNKDYEELMLQKLKVECGHNTVNKLASMFNDINLSKDLMTEFKKTGPAAQIANQGVDFVAEVLTNGHWPEQPQPTCTLPAEMKEITIKFEQFYRHKYQNRHVTWLLNQGSIEMRPVFITQKPYIFIVNCYQAIVLLLFNKNEELTFDQVKEITTISDKEKDLSTALMYLCNPRLKILDKENMKKPEFAPGEKLKVTAGFTNPNIKVSFIPPQRQEVEKKQDKPDPERKNIIDAVIVRVMKARKTEKHNQLIEDVIKQISIFLAQPPMIKERIESLIEREYLKRDETDRSKYIYLP